MAGLDGLVLDEKYFPDTTVHPFITLTADDQHAGTHIAGNRPTVNLVVLLLVYLNPINSGNLQQLVAVENFNS
jgi:hypothetical protein